MSVYKRGNSKYWYVQFQIDGKTYLRSSKTTDKRVAESLEGKWKNEVIRSEYLGEKERITFFDALDSLIESKKQHASYDSFLNYQKMILKYISGSLYLDQITTKEIYKFYGDLRNRRYQPSTCRRLLNIVKQTIDLAKRMGYLIPDPEYPKVSVKPTRFRYLSIDEEKKLLESLDPKRSITSQPPYEKRRPEFNAHQQQHYDFVLMLLDTGARFSEIATLEWSAIDLETKTINLWRPKVRNESILYMTDRVYEVLKRKFETRTGRYIFTNTSGGPMSYIPKMWRRTFERAGLENASPHTLRHTLATRLVQSGLTIYEVKEILGHTDIKTTMRYSHLERVDAMKKARDVLNALNSIPSSVKSRTTPTSDTHDKIE